MRRSGQKSGASNDKHIPPYVPYGTFRTFIKRLGGNVPRHVDRGLMPFISGTVQSQLMATLRYLGMVHQNGQPTDRLTRLIKSGCLDSKDVFNEIVTSSYADLFNPLDLARASAWQIEERFREAGASGVTLRKCIAFFLAAAREAGLQVSQEIKPFAGARGRAARRTATPAALHQQSTEQAETASTTTRSQDLSSNWRDSLLSKFPSFEPTWPDEVKVKWFDAFEKLMKMLERKATPAKSDEG